MKTVIRAYDFEGMNSAAPVKMPAKAKILDAAFLPRLSRFQIIAEADEMAHIADRHNERIFIAIGDNKPTDEIGKMKFIRTVVLSDGFHKAHIFEVVKLYNHKDIK